MIDLLGNFFTNIGITRDSALWVRTQILIGASLVVSGVFNVQQWAMDYLGWTLTGRELKWFWLICAGALWLAGKYDSSPLPGDPKPYSYTLGAGPMKPPTAAVILLPLLLIAGVSLSGCANVMTQVVKSTTAAIADANQLHCGVVGAPLPPACLTDAQFQKVNADLNAASQAELAYTQIQAGVATAQGQTVAQAVLTITSALSQALQDLFVGVNDVSSTAANDIKAALSTALAKL